MRYLFLFSNFLLTLISYTTYSQTDSSLSTSTHEYAVPEFEDVKTFDRMEEAFPVISHLFLNYAKANSFPSISFGIVARGELVYSESSGSANLSSDIKSDSNTLYRIASMSKSFTAMAILKLRDEGRLNLFDPVSNHLPEMDLAGKLTTDAPEITIHHLLTMSAGFPEDNPWGDRQLDATDEELLEVLREGISFSNVPGVTYEYSNLGYALLGKIIGNVSGRPYQQYIMEEILLPLGMEDTRWEYSEIPKASLALGYLWQDGEWMDVPLLHDGAYGAMGGMISSIADFSKYMAFHLDAWPARDDPEEGPIRRSSIREMHQPWRFANLQVDAKTPFGADCPSVRAYGYGLSWQKDCRGIIRIAHSGGLPGYGSEWRIYPDYGIGIVSFSNHTYGAPVSVNAIALDTLISIANLAPRVIKPSPILEQRKLELLEVLQTWEEDKLGIFADNFFLDEPLERRKAAADSILLEAGAIQETSKITALNQLRGSFIITGENRAVEVFFTLNPQREALVQWFGLRLLE